MMRVVYFSQLSGEVSQILTGPSLEGMLIAGAGQCAALTDYTGQLPAFWDGEQVQPVPPKPSQAHVWDWPTKTWVLTLAAAKTAAWARVKKARLDAHTAPLHTPYGVFSCHIRPDSNAQIDITEQYLLSQGRHNKGEQSDVEHTLANNEPVTLSYQAITEVAMLMGERKAEAHNAARAIRPLIEAASSQQELEAVLSQAQPVLLNYLS